LGLDFPNLPYYIDGELKITESWAILKYVANKAGIQLAGAKEEAIADMVAGVVNDFRMSFVMMCYRSNFEENKANFLEGLPKRLEGFNQFLSGKKWAAGDNLSYVDFAFAEILDHVRMMNPGCDDKYSNVKEYLDRFFDLEKIKSYRCSERFFMYPVNNRMANWGAKAPTEDLD
jgi:glutathione S-transferase